MKTYAGFWQRVKAFAFDYLVILGYLIALTLLFLIVNRSPSATQWLFVSQIRAQVTFILLLTLPVALYFAISESSTRQATWGKQRLGLMVTDKNGNRIRFWRAFARALLKLIPWEIAHTLIWEIRFQSGIDPVLINYGFASVYVLVGLNAASLIITKTHQTLYDFLARTYVVK
jgi:uncharacterized RDD family membrane protein YckC